MPEDDKPLTAQEMQNVVLFLLLVISILVYAGLRNYKQYKEVYGTANSAEFQIWSLHPSQR